MRCEGTDCRSYSCVQVRMRSPSGMADGRMRGLAPTATTIVSASTRSKSVPVSPLAGRDDDRSVAVEPAFAADDANARPHQFGPHVLRLLPGQPDQALVDRREVDRDLRADRLAGLSAVEELHAEIGGLADRVRRLRRRDEALGGDHVGDDGRAADAGALDDRDVGAELRARERRLVTTGTAAEHCDALLALEFIGHGSHSSVCGCTDAHPAAGLRKHGGSVELAHVGIPHEPARRPCCRPLRGRARSRRPTGREDRGRAPRHRAHPRQRLGQGGRPHR